MGIIGYQTLRGPLQLDILLTGIFFLNLVRRVEVCLYDVDAAGARTPLCHPNSAQLTQTLQL